VSKIVASPIKRWPGTVTLCDPLTFPQVFALQDAFEAVSALEKPTLERLNYALLPAMLECVERWDLAGFPARPAPADFPASPKSVREDAAALIAWLIEEIRLLFAESEAVPLAS
jgi:hypothetical protein